MPRIDTHHGGPELRGQARAAEVHQLKAEGKSPSRSHWREAAAATPAVEVSYSAEAAAVIAAETSAVAGAAAVEAVPAEASPAEVTAGDTVEASALDGATASPEVATEALSATGIVAEALVEGLATPPPEPGSLIEVVA